MISIAGIMQVLDIFFGVVGLLLILRIVLQIFGMRWGHPLLQMVVAITDPILNVTNRLLGLPTYQSSYRVAGPSRTDLLSSVAAVVVLWATRTLVTWTLRLVLLVPRWFAQPMASIGGMLGHGLSLVFDLYSLALFVRVLFSWVRASYSSRVMRFLYKITEPVLAPIRGVLPPMAGIDFSPIIAFFLLRLVQQVVFSMLSWVF